MRPTLFWQITAEAPPANGRQLSTFDAYKTIDQIAGLQPKRFIITGGNPLTRKDFFELLDYAHRRGLVPSVTVSPTRSLTADDIETLRHAGITRLIFNVNGSAPVRHDGFYGTPGSFGATDRAMRWARDAGLSIEVNTLITPRTINDLAQIADLIKVFAVAAWNLYFPVPIADARNIVAITAEEAERVFSVLAGIAASAHFEVRTFEASHYQRYLLQHSWADFCGYVGSDEEQILFITAEGDVRASEFLPINAGNVRDQSLSSIYRAGDLFVALRDRSNLTGKCARCEYRNVCGGSRARAWMATGDLFASDPLCAYQPHSMEIPA